MNRNAVVGVVILGVALSGVSIGSATYLSSKSVEASSERLASNLRDEAGKREELSSRIDARQNTLLAIKGGMAESLAAKGEGYALWSRGRFVVSDPAAGDAALFEVDPSSASVASSGNLGVGGQLVVADAVSAAGMDATGRISGASLTTRGFAVDSHGDMTASSLTLGSNANICGDLVVKGSRIELGPAVGEDPALAFSNDPASGRWVLAVHGAVKARELDIIENGEFAAGNGTFRIDSSGMATVAGELTVSGPATFSGTFAVADMNAGNTAIDGMLTARGADFGGVVSATGARLSGRLTAPDASFEQSLAVSGQGTFHSLVAGSATVEGDADMGGCVSAGSIVAAGGVTADSLVLSGRLSASNGGFIVDGSGGVTAGSLVLADGFSAAGGRFVVDRSGGVRIDGRLAVGSDAEFSSALTVEGDATFGSIQAGPITSGSITSTGLLATSGDVSCDGLIATNRIALVNDTFVVNGAGDVAMSGSLEVMGDVTASGSLRVAGPSAMEGGLTVSGGIVLSGRRLHGLASGSVSLASTGTVDFPSDIPASARLVATPTSGTEGDGDWWVTGRTLYSEGARSFDWIATW